MVDLFASGGETSDLVSTHENVAGVMTKVLSVKPDRGTFLRILNRVAKGDMQGLPLYMTLLDAGGVALPTNTKVEIRAKLAGMDQAVKISERKSNISFYNTNSLTVQRNEDNVDGAKIVLTSPEVGGNGAPRQSVDIRDIDEFQICIQSASVIDWATHSELFVESNAVSVHQR